MSKQPVFLLLNQTLCARTLLLRKLLVRVCVNCVAEKLQQHSAAFRVRQVGYAITRLPEDFKPHKQIRRVYDQRRKMIETGEGIDWAMAEALAFGTLLSEGACPSATGPGSHVDSWRPARVLDQVQVSMRFAASGHS